MLPKNWKNLVPGGKIIFSNYGVGGGLYLSTEKKQVENISHICVLDVPTKASQ